MFGDLRQRAGRAGTVLLAAMVAGCCSTAGLPVTELDVHGAALQLEVAANRGARSCGLSTRRSLPADRGMLFVVPEPESLEFWMRDTSLPLSIAFLDADGRILSIESMAPQQRGERYRSPAPARYAIEVNAGWFQTHGAKVGDVLEISLPADLQVR